MGVSGSYQVRTDVIQVLRGTPQVSLKWNFIKPSSWYMELIRTEFTVNDDDIGNIHHSTGKISIRDWHDYPTRFSISQNEVATLVLNNVTGRERATFQCKVVMRTPFFSYPWFMSTKIFVDVKGKDHLKHIFLLICSFLLMDE